MRCPVTGDVSGEARGLRKPSPMLDVMGKGAGTSIGGASGTDWDPLPGLQLGVISAISSSRRSVDRLAVVPELPDKVDDDEGMAMGALPPPLPPSVTELRRPRARRLPASELLDAL